MKKYFYSLIVVIACSFIFQACVPQQLEVNPGFAKKASSEILKPRVAEPVIGSSVKAEKPEWEIGYWWKYAWKRPGKSGTIIRRVIREDTFEGHPSFVVKEGKSQYFFTKDVLGSIAKMSEGKLVWKRDVPRQNFAWPLEVGREWRNSYLKENIAEETSQTYEYRMVVAKLEEVRLPAGKFKCFKTEVYVTYTGDLLAVYWYSPEVKSYVKYKEYTSKGLREGELISFKVD